MRDYLGGMFWPDLSEGRARRRLSHTLWQVQDALSEVCDPQRFLAITPDELAFAPTAPYWLDAEEFERTLEEVGRAEPARAPAADLERLRRSVELYRGDLLPGFYEEWVVREQERYQQLFLSALEQLVSLEKAHGNHEEALTYARRLTHHDPLREASHQEVMRLCFLLGRVNEAMAQYRRCASVLAEELGTQPSPDTTALYDKIARYRQIGLRPLETEPPPPLFQPGGKAPFVGRTEERSTLVDALESALASRGGVVVVEGEAGIGKTRLVREITEDARWRGFDVLWGACDQLGALRPYESLTSALAGGLTVLRTEQLSQQVDGIWLSEVAQLIPSLEMWSSKLPAAGSLRGKEAQERKQEALVQLVLAIGRLAPHLIVIDDLQWADKDTLRALTRLVDRVSASQVLLCVTYRHDEARQRADVWDAIRELDRKAGRGRVLLGPLSVFDTAELVGRGFGAPRVPNRFVTRLHRETSGTPLFVLETLRVLHEEGHSLADLETSQLPLPASIYHLVADRVAALEPEVRSVLEAVAVHSTDVDLPALLATAEGSRPAVLAAVDEAERTGLLVGGGDEYGFHHDAVRRVIYGEIPAKRRRLLHIRVAEVLEAQHPERCEELAHHYTEGGVSDKAAAATWEAARRAERLFGYETAARHYAAAVGLAGPAAFSPGQRFELLGEYEATLGVLGRRHEQDEVLGDMAQLAAGRPDRLGEVERRRAWLLANTDRFAEAEQAARRALELAGTGTEAEGGALAALGAVLSWSGKVRQAIPHLRAALEVYMGNPSKEPEARLALGTALSYEEYDEAEGQLEAALDLCVQTNDQRGQAEALGGLASIQMERGDASAAERSYRQALSLCQDMGYRYGEAVNLVNLANHHYVSGRTGEAVGSYEQALEVFRAIGNARGEAMVRANAASVDHQLLGDDDRAAEWAGAALEFFEEIGDERGQAQCLEVLGGIARRRGKLARARRLLESGIYKAEASGRRWVEVQLLRALALLDLDAGDTRSALARIGEAEETCRQLGLRDVEVSLLATRGLVLAADGNMESALEATAAAMRGLGPSVEQGYLVPHAHATVLALARPEEPRREFIDKAYRGLIAVLEGLHPDQLEKALAVVPEHRAIVDSWEETAPPAAWL